MQQLKCRLIETYSWQNIFFNYIPTIGKSDNLSKILNISLYTAMEEY